MTSVNKDRKRISQESERLPAYAPTSQTYDEKAAIASSRTFFQHSRRIKKNRKRPLSFSNNAQRNPESFDKHPAAKRRRYDQSTTKYKTDHRKNAPVQPGMRYGAETNRKSKKRDLKAEHEGSLNEYKELRETKRTGNTSFTDHAKQKEKEVKPISYKALEEICQTTDKDKAMLKICNIVTRYVALLNSKEEIREDLFKLVIDSLLIVLESTNRKPQARIILSQTQQQLLRFHLSDFIVKLPNKKVSNLDELIMKLVNIFEALLQRMENIVAVHLPLPQLNNVVEELYSEGRVKEHIKERLEKTNALWKDVKKRISNRGPNGENLEPPNNFRELSVVPDYTDFQPGTKPFLRANVIDKPYSNVEHYLDVQFRLLREDFIMPLRDGVKQLRRERHMLENGPERQDATKKEQQSFVYHDVKILNPVCNRNGGVYRIRFNARHPTVRRVKWEKSKRLKFGALVCLSPDYFSTLYFGAVENRNSLNLSYGELDLRFENFDTQLMRQFIVDQASFQMVESDSYFEAYRHNLSALRQLNEENLPFKEHIVHCNSDIKPPKYLTPNPDQLDQGLLHPNSDKETNSSSKNQVVQIDMTSIADPEYVLDFRLNVSRVPVLNVHQWPSKEALELDESQYRACQLALTKRFALIQGPPGTGKTYVGLKIAQVLLDNKKLWDNGFDRSPLLMVSYTNHALDQFLMGLKDRKGIVRVGGRSKEEQLQGNNLKVLRRQDIVASTRERGRIWARIREIEERFRPKEANLLIAESNKAILSVEMLKMFMEKKHFENLMYESLCDNSTLNETLIRWLGVEIKDSAQKNQKIYSHSAGFRLMFSLREYDDDDEDEEDYDDDRNFSVTACQLDDAVNPGELRKNLENYNDIMFVRDERRITNIFQIRYRKRWALYRLWRSRLQKNCQRRIRATQDEQYETELKKLHEIDKDKDLMILQKARVVGMTTTNAAKYHDLLQRVRPKIVIVEEAAEVLEAHILTSLPLDCEHVILIGDHQQLRPSCTVYELAKKYKLNISMFERLVKLQMPCVRLSEQHRMRPEIASLMKHIYEDLYNHPSVNDYEDVQGFQHSVFFIDHRYPESDSEDSHSHLNEHEAQFVAKLCRYIIQQGYQPSQMTILTPYLGQMFTIRDQVTSEGEDLRQIRLTTVDNYQGEENDIILLSLVRSNETGHVGFVNDINRACVALSRARMGLYVIGNFELLSEKSDIWKKVVSDLKERNQIGEALPLICKGHNTKRLVKKPNDFQEMVPDGGCSLPCEFRLSCGHACTKLCHPSDQDHKTFRCMEQCVRSIQGCNEGHLCQKACWEVCQSECTEIVDKILLCNHVKENVECGKNPNSIKCSERCEKRLKCDHQCQARCGEPCTSACQELVKRDWPCGHKVNMACSATPLDCGVHCGLLSCGHECSGHCGECLQGRVHKRCKKKCGRILVCGHACLANCTTACPPCTRKCETRCKHSKCRNKCSELCRPCEYGCKWKCKHIKCEKKCGEVCDRPRCNEPCKKIIETCGHKCRGLCEESCVCVTCHRNDIQELFGTEDFEDDTVRFLRLRDCKHIFEVSGIDHWVDMENSDSEDTAMIQMKACPSCKAPIRTSLRYNTIIKKQLENIEEVKKVILGDQETFHQDRCVLQEKMRSYVKGLGKSSTETKRKRKCEDLERRIENAKSRFELTNLENQIKLLERCKKLLERCKRVLGKSRMIQQESGAEARVDTTEIPSIISTLNYLTNERIIGCDVERELRDIDLEISRQSLRLELCSLLKDIKASEVELKPEDQEQVDHIRSKCSQASRIEEDILELDLKRIEEIRSKYPVTPLTREEKDQIIKAMGLSKGHWYKCPQGHIYAIGECGGAMERGTCPECKETIGGARHKLEEGNEVATEMDGAKYSAWSEQANMANYDLQE